MSANVVLEIPNRLHDVICRFIRWQHGEHRVIPFSVAVRVNKHLIGLKNTIVNIYSWMVNMTIVLK